VPNLRAGLIGFGHGGAVFHAPLISCTHGLTLAAIVTRDPDRRHVARQRYPSAAILDRPETLTSGDFPVDLIVVASPNRTHVPLALAALEHDLPVVVDKPLAASAAAAESLLEVSRQRGVMLTVFHNRRWDGDCLTVQRLLAEGTLGDIHRFESRYERWRPTPRQTWRESDDAADAGGLLFDLGSHLIDQALRLFGPVETVYAELDRRRAGTQVDDDVFVAMTHQTGVRSLLWTSNVAGQRGPRMRLLGSAGSYVKWHLDVQEDALKAGDLPASAGWGEEPAAHWGRVGTDEASTALPTEPGRYPEFYAQVVRCLRGEGPCPVDPAEAVAVLAVIEAARDSARTRRVVRSGLAP
jgi:predicted dehydrogenase